MKKALILPIIVLIGMIFLACFITVTGCNDGKGDEVYVGCTVKHFSNLPAPLKTRFIQNGLDSTVATKITCDSLDHETKLLMHQNDLDTNGCYKIEP